MKELTGSGSATTSASPADCMTLLEDIDRYPTWAPDIVKEAEVLERDAAGHPVKARTKLHVERGPLTRDFNLVLDVKIDQTGTIALRRIPHRPTDQERFDVTWRVDGGQSTRIALDLAANLDVPRFIPVGDVGDAMAQQLVSAATRALQSSA
ncbi:MAG: SRPBCC family protein [Solirubrobacteraceae bacterium]